MNSKLISVISIIALVIIAVITNPKKQLHGEKLSEKTPLSGNQNLMLKIANSELTTQVLDYNNYVLFSIGNYKQIQSLGIFGNVFVLTSDEEIDRLNKLNTKNIPEKSKKKIDPETQKKIDVLIGD